VNFSTDGFLDFFAYQALNKKCGGIMINKGINGSCFAMAMRAVSTKDFCLSLGLAAVVVAFTSVIGSMT
jgi:hypothetical protein